MYRLCYSLSQLPHADWLGAGPSGTSCEYAVKSLQGGTERSVFCLLWSALSPRGIATETALCTSVKNCFLVCYCPVGLVNASPQMYIKARWSKGHPLGSGHKSWRTRKMYKLHPKMYWRFGFIIGASWREVAGKVPASCPRLQGGLQSVPRCVPIRSGLPPAAACIQWKLFQGNTEIWTSLSSPSAQSPGVITTASTAPITASLFAIVLWVSLMQALLAYRAMCFGGPSLRWQP